MGIRIKKKGLRHGVLLPNYNPTSSSPIEKAPLPKKVIIHLYRNDGEPCNTLVKRGDRVLTGQKIGDSEDFATTPIHATVSGEISAIAKLIDPASGHPEDSLIITSDGEDEWVEIKATENPEALSVKEILERIREAGIVGGGGNTLPAHIKLSPPDGKRIDTVILNGCECEPYLTSNKRLMLENGEAVLSGLNIIKKIFPAVTIYIAIEDNRDDVIEHMQKLATNSGLTDYNIIPLKPKYPAGSEKILIDTILDREVPFGETAADIGVAVVDVAMAKAIHDAVIYSKPFVEKVIAVSGSVRRPKNLLVRLGTPLGHLIDYCGGIEGEANEVISGGLMTGTSQYDLDFPVTGETDCVLIVKSTPSKERDCIRCGWCLEVCSVRLMPTLLASYARTGRYDDCKEAYIDSCFECGACAYICPSNIPLLQYIKIAKSELAKRATTK